MLCQACCELEESSSCSMEKPCGKGAGLNPGGCLGRGEGEWIRNRQQPLGQSEAEPSCSFSIPIWDTPGPAHCPERVASPASQNSSQRKANSSAVRCITRKKGVLVLGAEWLPANFGIKVEQRIPGAERGLGGEETGSSEQQRGQAGRSLMEGHAPQGPGQEGPSLPSWGRAAGSAVRSPGHLPSMPRMGRTHGGEAALTHG